MSEIKGFVHIGHPEDGMYALCGEILTRDNPESVGAEVTCLKCLMLEEEGKQARLE